ncbi:hypothetical protein J6590_027529 [Homalodisca vitripennis]|nr:hypothetical protein J6590_027529 [Homalodisca vitripennis]
MTELTITHEDRTELAFSSSKNRASFFFFQGDMTEPTITHEDRTDLAFFLLRASFFFFQGDMTEPTITHEDRTELAFSSSKGTIIFRTKPRSLYGTHLPRNIVVYAVGRVKLAMTAELRYMVGGGPGHPPTYQVLSLYYRKKYVVDPLQTAELRYMAGGAPGRPPTNQLLSRKLSYNPSSPLLDLLFVQ